MNINLDRLEATRKLMDLMCGVGDGFTISNKTFNDYAIRKILTSIVGEIDIISDEDNFTLLQIPSTQIFISLISSKNKLEIF